LADRPYRGLASFADDPEFSDIDQAKLAGLGCLVAVLFVLGRVFGVRRRRDSR
jgi:hypothetical protein